MIKVKKLDYIWSKDGNILGIVGGVFLNSLYLDKKEMVEKLVLAIDKLKDENIGSLIMEDLSQFNMTNLKEIEKKTNLQVVNGINTLIFFLPLVLRQIYKGLNEDLKDKEILIIGDKYNDDLTIGIIEALCDEIRFITLTGNYDGVIENISQYILEKTGLSIFYSKKVDKILTNYSIIINLRDDCSLNMNKLRKKAIIFDFSISKRLKNQGGKIRTVSIIEDFIFKTDRLDIKESKFINSLIPSYIYEQFNICRLEDFAGLSIGGEFYNVKSFVDYQIRIKGKV